MFIDETTITVIAGDGGDGCSSFRREKFVPRGGPDGGDGGTGGDIILVADENVSTLLAFRYRSIQKSERGRHGQGSDKTGRGGQDLIVNVPVGTGIYDEHRIQMLADLSRPGARFVAARGGRGGRGNARFKSSINQAPRRKEEGHPGEQRKLVLELKLLADVGLLGFPNAGKSTLISRISAARPKIADYPFTTLEPSLGVVDRGNYRSFVVADIPGLIEGAHLGAGLGHRFLRHVERCRLLLHLVDPTDIERDPVEGIEILNNELRHHRAELGDRPQVLVMTKSDAWQEQPGIERVKTYAASQDIPVLMISAVSGDGLETLIHRVGDHLDRLPAPIFAHKTSRDNVAGVLGGTFNPVHRGHVKLCQRVQRILDLPRMLLMLAARPPHKEHDQLASVETRLSMLRLALAGQPTLEASTLELQREGVGYTIDTLRDLRQADPPTNPLFVVGMDALIDLPNWRAFEELITEFDFIAVDRADLTLEGALPDLVPEVKRRLVTVAIDNVEDDLVERLDPGAGGRIFYLPGEPVAVSSSKIRARAAGGESLDDLVAPAVAEYILKNGLYRQEKSDPS